MIASGTRIPRDSFLISDEHSTSESKVWLDYTIDDAFNDFCFYSRKQLLVHGCHKNSMDLFRHKIQVEAFLLFRTSMYQLWSPFPHPRRGKPPLWYFSLSRRSRDTDFHGPVCSSYFWLNHIWPTSQNTSFANKKINANTMPYHRFRYKLPANSLPTMVGLVETWKLIFL